MNKKELEARCETLANLLFEAYHLLSTEEDYGDVDRQELITRFLRQCNKEGFA